MSEPVTIFCLAVVTDPNRPGKDAAVRCVRRGVLREYSSKVTPPNAAQREKFLHLVEDEYETRLVYDRAELDTPPGLDDAVALLTAVLAGDRQAVRQIAARMAT